MVGALGRRFDIRSAWSDSPMVVTIVIDDAIFEFAHIVASHAVNARAKQLPHKTAVQVVDEIAVVKPDGCAGFSMEVTSHL